MEEKNQEREKRVIYPPLFFKTVNSLEEKEIRWPTTDKYSLSVFHVNIRSIRKNFLELEALLKTSKKEFDIIICTEVNIKNEINNYNIKGYVKYQKLRKSKKGGGIVIFGKKRIGDNRN